jgi:aerobic carbon-monoxide dehydrogenase medium subunit
VYTTRPAEFTYRRASTVDEAVSLLAELDDARPLAGGHSLLPAMKLRLSTPGALVDIGRIPGLSGIERDGNGIRIGALATHAAVASSELVRGECPVLAETAALIGDRQVRNRGTIGGSVAHADPGADYPTVLKALGATVTVAGRGGTRDIAADDFFTGMFTTSLGDGELVTSVQVPAAKAAAYVKHKHPASGFAVVGVAAVVAGDGAVRLVVGGATGTPVDAASVDEVPEALTDALGDAYASAEYRRHLATVLARRALTAASARAG